jgi:hypothetical protein
MTVEQLVGVLARLIYDNRLRDRHGEDTMGVLTKCGAFQVAHSSSNFVVELARAIDAVKMPDESRSGLAEVGDVYSFEYEGNDAKYNEKLAVTEVLGGQPNDLVFFEDGSHSKQKNLLGVKRIARGGAP